MQTYVVSADDVANNPLLTTFGINAGDTLSYEVIPAAAPEPDVQESTSENEAEPDVQESTT